MSKAKKISLIFLNVIAITAIITSCSKEAESKPNYLFKAAPNQGMSDGSPNDPAFKIGDIVVANAELNKGIEVDLYEARMKLHEIKMNRLRALVLEKLMDADPKKKGLSNDEYLDKYIAKNVEISKREINKFIKEKNIPSQHVDDTMKERIRKYLTLEKKKEEVEKWIGEKTKKTPVEIYFPEPKRPVYDVAAGDSPAWGGDNAKVTIVEYSDFQCPYCKQGSEIISQLKKKYKNKIKVVFKNFPLPFHTHAKGAAVAGLCAQEQSNDLFWRLHDHMFENQTELSRDDLKKVAGNLGINKEMFEKCLDSNKHVARVDKDIEQGRDIGVKSTPTFFVNGMIVNGARPIEEFEELIEKGLAK